VCRRRPAFIAVGRWLLGLGLGVALALSLAATGCGPQTEAPSPAGEDEAPALVVDQTPGPTPTDQRVAIDIRFAWAADPRIDVRHFAVEVHDGVARVRASTPHGESWDHAQTLAGQVSGVREVVMETPRPGALPALTDPEGPADTPVEEPLSDEALAALRDADTLVRLGDPTTAAPDPTVPVAGEAPSGTGDRPRTYRVRAGDTLSRIAQRTMGSGGQWRALYEYNRAVIGSNPERLREGMELRIPQE
jgi:nucleoid-associated protein YgaU